MHGLEGVVEDAELFDGEKRGGHWIAPTGGAASRRPVAVPEPRPSFDGPWARGTRTDQRSRPKIHLPHPLVGKHRVRRALADDRAEVQDGETAGDALEGMDDVLDPDDRRALRMDGGEDREKIVAFGVGEAAGDLVEQQELRLGGDRLGELEPLEIEQRQRAGGFERERSEAGQRQRLVRLAPPAGIARPPPWVAATSTFSNTLICANGLGT